MKLDLAGEGEAQRSGNPFDVSSKMRRVVGSERPWLSLGPTTDINWFLIVTVSNLTPKWVERYRDESTLKRIALLS